MCKTKDTGTNKDQNLDKTPKNKNNQKVSDKFFWFVLISTVIFALAQVYNCCKAKERQDRILGILLDSKTVSNSHDRDVINYSDSSVVDSNFLNKRDSLQSSKKDTIVFLEKENKDPELNTSPNITSTIENIEKLLHLEFAKIQEERNALTLWIGIITVVFLIFSFYSMLKSDDLVRQSREGLNKIQDCNFAVNEIKRKWEEKLNNIDEDLDEKLKSLDKKFTELKNDNDKSFKELNSENKEFIISYINSRFPYSKEDNSNSSGDYPEEKIDDMENDKEYYTPNTNNPNSDNNENSSDIDKNKDDDEQ